MQIDSRSVIKENIQWFLKSGIMRPKDGFWGVGERLLVADGNEALEKINRYFYCQTKISDEVVAIEHRRADCNFQTALEFYLASEALGDPSLKTVSDNIIEFLSNRSALRNIKEDSPAYRLWGWSMPLSFNAFWTDDNSWVVTLLLMFSKRSYPNLREYGITAARTMRKHMSDFYDCLDRYGKNYRLEKEIMYGTNLSPHWLGLTTMAFTHASVYDNGTDYTGVIERYYKYAPSGPPDYMLKERRQTMSGMPWTMSEYGYLSLCSSIVAKQFGMKSAWETAILSADALVSHQYATGHFAAEYDEAPTASNLADLVYTQNWATLGLYHAWKLTGKEAYRNAFDLSLGFLEKIQDKSRKRYFRGCWRGLYDTDAGKWGGGDRWEGGQRSIYSGWTNAPIALAFLFYATGESLFA